MKTALSQYARLRCAIVRLENQLKKVEENAILEAFEIAANQSHKRSGSKIVYEDFFAKITLVLRTRQPGEKEDEVLENLSRRITEAQHKLAKKHSVRLDKINEQLENLNAAIAQLEAERDALFFTPEIGKLKNRYAERRETIAYQVPGLTASISALVALKSR